MMRFEKSTNWKWWNMTKFNETNEQYHRPDGYVSSSMLRTLADSPAKYHAEYITRVVEREETPAMALGTAVHTAALEPERYAAEYAVTPLECSDRRTKAYKEWSAGCDPGVKVLTQNEAETVAAMVAGLRANPAIAALLDAAGYVEVPIRWEDSYGVTCKIRPDKVMHSPIILDIKTTQECTVHAFEQSIGTYRYDLQAAFYLRGMTQGRPNDYRFLFLVIEKTQPFRARIFEIEDESMRMAHDKIESLLGELHRRKKNNYWLDDNQHDITKVRTPFYRLQSYDE